MKICPNCKTKYTDESLQFCLQDGSPLESGAAQTSSMETIEIPEQETVVSARSPERINFDLKPPEEETWQKTRPTAVAGGAERRSSNVVLAVLLTALGMLILFGVVGIGAWLYLGSDRREVSTTQDNTAQTGVEDKSNTDESQNDKSTPQTPEPKTNLPPAGNETVTPAQTPATDPTLPPNADKGEAKDQVAKELLAWKSLAESRSLNAYMSKYADRIDYYTKSGASRAFVRSDKRRAFTAYTSIRARFTNISVVPSDDGRSAVATFDKEWDFSNSSKRTTGKVRSRLVFRRFGDKWLIVSERDLKVYYVNR